MKRLVPIVLGILLVTCIMLVAVRALSYPFFLDDHDQWGYVQGKNSLAECLTWDCYGLYRPVKNVLYYGLDRWGERSVQMSHWLCLGLYLVTTGLVWGWFYRWFRHGNWASAATAIWALAPTQVSSLIWLSCANIVLAVGAVAGALSCYDLARVCWPQQPKRSMTWLGLSALVYLFALFCYEGAIILPGLLALVDWRRGRGIWRKINVVMLLPFAVLAVGFVCLRWSVVPPNELTNPAIRVAGDWQISLASAYFALQHLWSWLAPWGRQELIGTFVWGQTVSVGGVVLCWLLVIWLLVQAFKLRHRYPDVTLGVLWFFVAFLPMSNLIPFKNGPFGDYYLVIPSLGLAWAVVGLLRQLTPLWWARKTVPVLCRVGTVCFLGLVCWRAATIHTVLEWCDTWGHRETLFYRSMLVRPYSFRARANLATGLHMRGHLEEAKTLIHECIDQAPWVPIHYNILGDIQSKEGDFTAACASFNRALALESKNLYSHYALARTCMEHLDDPQGALEHSRWLVACHWNRYTEDSAIGLSRIQCELGEPDKALEVLHEVCHRSAHADKARKELKRLEATLAEQKPTHATAFSYTRPVSH
ncbi:hypothetical protein ACFL6U_21050 [Planctomycetota bacterium]